MNLPQFMPFYGISSQFSLIESLIPNRPTGPQWSRPWVPWVPWQIVRTPSFGADAEVTISIGVEAPSHTIIQTHKQVVEPGKNGEPAVIFLGKTDGLVKGKIETGNHGFYHEILGFLQMLL